jgi:hypothetical protein
VQALLVLLVLGFTLVRVQSDQGILVRLLSLLGIRRRLTRSESTSALIAGGLVVLLLFVAIDPEVRIFLMFLDSAGIDLFVILCALCIRHNLAFVAAMLLIPILRRIYRWGPVPGFWPSRLVMTSSPSWAGYAIAVPVMALCWAALLALGIMAALSGVADLVKLIYRVVAA